MPRLSISQATNISTRMEEEIEKYVILVQNFIWKAWREETTWKT
jgi:hypothetical protein